MSDIYDLEPEPSAPVLWGRTLLAPSADESIGALAAHLLQQAHACASEFGSFHLALTGDTLLEPVYRRLMYDPPLRHLPWHKTHLWLIDETADPPRRFDIIEGLIAQHAGVPSSQVHPIDLSLPDPAAAYERELQAVLEWREKGHDRLDMAILALSDDAPPLAFSPHDDPAPPLVAQDARHVAMTPRLINASRLVSIFVTGPDARARLARIESNQASRWRAISPLAGSLHWYLDRDACNDPTNS